MIKEAVAAAKIHLEIGELRDLADGSKESWAVNLLKRIDLKLVVHEEREPEPEAADFDGLLLEIDAEEGVLDVVGLGVLAPSAARSGGGVLVAVGGGLEDLVEGDEFVEQADGKRT